MELTSSDEGIPTERWHEQPLTDFIYLFFIYLNFASSHNNLIQKVDTYGTTNRRDVLIAIVPNRSERLTEPPSCRTWSEVRTM